MFKIIFLYSILILFSYSAEARYVCTEDSSFKDWISGTPVDVNDNTVLVKYDSMNSCESECRKTSVCGSTDTLLIKNIAPMETSYTEAQKNTIESSIAGKSIKSIKIETPNGTSVLNTPSFNGSLFLFPTGTLSSDSSILSKTIYSNTSLVITTYKLLPFVYTTTQINNSSVLTDADLVNLNNIVNSYITSSTSVEGFEVNSNKIIFSSPVAIGSFTWLGSDGEKTLFNNGDYSFSLVTNGLNHYIKYKSAGVVKYAFKDGVSDTLSVITKTRSATPKYRISVNNGTSNIIQSSQWTSDSLALVSQNDKIGLTVSLSVSGYSCPLYSINTDLGGDIASNVFSNSSSCLSSCYIQNNCSEWTENPKCHPVAFEKSHPVSDWTGKTVFTKYHVSWDCQKIEIIPGGCREYNTTTISASEDWNLSGIGWKSKNFQSPDEAMTGVVGLEQFQHLWSGWVGRCEYGIKYDSSWMSDPMTLLSFAMMAYKGAMSSAKVAQAANDASNSVTTAYNNVASSIGSAWSSATNGISSTYNSAATVASAGSTVASAGSTVAKTASAGQSIFSGAIKELHDWSKVNLINATSYSQAITNGSALMDAVYLGMAAASPISNNDAQTANDFMKAQLGSADASVAAVNYAQCMASIGLSFPNLVGFSVDSNSSASSELRESWKNVISLTDDQVAGLMGATSEAFVRANYILIDHNNKTSIGRYFSMTAVGYTQAGQVICGNGRISRAMNALNQAATDKSKGGINTRALAEQAISQGLSHLPPPYNLIASIVFKIATSFSSGNACTDETIAQKWGLQQYKTNKGLIGNQCHYIISDCVAKWFWGSCMRHENNYCCYDQELTRIFVEGTKVELSKPWTVGSCDDISLTDLKDISFRKCLSSENPSKDKCFPANKWAELNNAMKKQITKGFDASSLVDSAINSMPVRNDPWGARIGD